MGWHNGKWWPLYVPDWYHPRVSQHPFDPYSFLHILHGFVFFGLWGWWPGMDWEEEWLWVWVEGPLLGLLVELSHEVVENTQWMIDLYRANSGTSAHYEGDSYQNIIGDLISATFGWYVAAVFHLAGYPWLVIVWYVLTEAVLTYYMRDCGLLVCMLLFCPNKTIQGWQYRGIPDAAPEKKVFWQKAD